MEELLKNLLIFKFICGNEFFLEKYLFFILVAKSPLFFVNYIYILNFLSQLNKKKKWESGQKARKPRNFGLFPSPLLFLKVGRKWANGHFFSQKCL
jgi:hypothetical protein